MRRALQLVILAIVSVALISCSGKVNPPGLDSAASDLSSSSLSDLERQLSMAKASGGMTPESYAEINSQLEALEKAGAEPDRISSLRIVLESIEVGGRGEEKKTTGNLTAPLEAVESVQQNYSDVRVYSKEELMADSAAQKKAKWPAPSTCLNSSMLLSLPPLALSKISYIVPMGQMAGDHVTPTDHGYIITNGPNLVDVVSPADGYILNIGAFPRPNDFRVVLWHSCTLSTIYIHLKEIAPEILAVTGNLPPGSYWFGDEGPYDNRILPIAVKAGQPIGKARGGFDFSVHDSLITLPGFVTPSLYDREPWKIHTADLFGYFEEPVQSKLKQKSLRTVEPVGGKIDYDIDGKLVGNWFIEGTDYQGLGEDCNYYECHLAFAYSNVQPDLIRVSIPNSGIAADECRACLGVYGLKNNAPDPAGIGVEDGLVKYELVGFELESDPRLGINAFSRNSGDVLGVLLVQMTGKRQIKVEVFPGKLAAEVGGFTSKAKIYHRDELVAG